MTKAINTVVLVRAPNHGSVSPPVPQHHGNDKTAVVTTMALKTKEVRLRHGLLLLVDMGLLLALVPLLGSKLHRLEVTITATRATPHLAMIRTLVVTALLLLHQG